MIRMLHIAGSMSPSGIGNFIMNAYRNVDRSLVQFDFIVCEHREVSFDEEITAMGGRVFYVTRKSVSPWKNFQEIRTIVKNGQYRFVFRHTDVATVALDLFAAKLGGAKERIAHSHSTSAKKLRVHKLFRPLLNAVCTRRFACSEEAGRWMYGTHKPFTIIMNGIDIPAFEYREQIRNQVRRELSVGRDTFVLGHVGNYMPVKNHTFMIAVFAELHSKLPDSKLLLVGDGALREQMEQQIRELQLEDSVLLTGVRQDIPQLLQAMDMFLFPSFYEGMPIALVEAQATGLPCVISEVVTDDVCVIPEVHKLPLEAGAAAWSDLILKLRAQGTDRPATAKREANKYQTDRQERNQLVAQAGFDVRALGEIYNRLAQGDTV